jgi:hypothetical protein
MSPSKVVLGAIASLAATVGAANAGPSAIRSPDLTPDHTSKGISAAAMQHVLQKAPDLIALAKPFLQCIGRPCWHQWTQSGFKPGSLAVPAGDVRLTFLAAPASNRREPV